MIARIGKIMKQYIANLVERESDLVRIKLCRSGAYGIVVNEVDLGLHGVDVEELDKRLEEIETTCVSSRTLYQQLVQLRLNANV